jgi:hypothetical protein
MILSTESWVWLQNRSGRDGKKKNYSATVGNRNNIFKTANPPPIHCKYYGIPAASVISTHREYQNPPIFFNHLPSLMHDMTAVNHQYNNFT